MEQIQNQGAISNATGDDASDNSANKQDRRLTRQDIREKEERKREGVLSAYIPEGQRFAVVI
jgi:hypothetical protein